MSLYKYVSISEYSISNLINNKSYFQSPVIFNDPYEFIFKFDVNDEIYVDFLKLIYGGKYVEFLEKN